MQAPRFMSAGGTASETSASIQELFLFGIGGILRCQLSVQSLLLSAETP